MDIKARISAMREKIARIANYKEIELELCDEEVKTQAKKIKDQTVSVLNDAITKIVAVSEEKSSGLELEEFVDKIEARFNEAYYYSLHRIDDIIAPNDGFNSSLNELKDGITDLGKGLYNNMKSFIEDEKTKESLNKLKDAAKDIFEKSKEAFENRNK